jgi:Thioredoxin
MEELIGPSRAPAADTARMLKGAVLSEVNQGILQVAGDSIDKELEWEFFCECGREDCHEYVSLTLEAYASLHKGGAVVAPSHRLSRADRAQRLRQVETSSHADDGTSAAGVVSKEADHAENVRGADPASRAKLVFFYSERSGQSRRVEGYLAQVLQRRRNHETFELVRVPVEQHPELAARFKVSESPTICIVEGRRLRKRIVKPRGCRQLEAELGKWLR